MAVPGPREGDACSGERMIDSLASVCEQMGGPGRESRRWLEENDTYVDARANH